MRPDALNCGPLFPDGPLAIFFNLEGPDGLGLRLFVSAAVDTQRLLPFIIEVDFLMDSVERNALNWDFIFLTYAHVVETLTYVHSKFADVEPAIFSFQFFGIEFA